MRVGAWHRAPSSWLRRGTDSWFTFHRLAVHRWAVLCGVLITLLGASAPSSAAVDPNTVAEEPRIDGWVTDVQGLPLAGATVALRPTPQDPARHGPLPGVEGADANGWTQIVTTDGAGRWSVAVAATGPYDLRVHAPGKAPVSAHRVPVRASRSLPIFRLVEARSVNLFVADASGTPLPGAEVSLVGATHPELPRLLDQARPASSPTRTGADGWTRLTVPDASNLLLQAQAVGFQIRLVEVSAEAAASGSATIALEVDPRKIPSTEALGPVAGVAMNLRFQASDAQRGAAWIDCGDSHPWRRLSPRGSVEVPAGARFCLLQGPGLTLATIPLGETSAPLGEDSNGAMEVPVQTQPSSLLEGQVVDGSGRPLAAVDVVAEVVQTVSRLELEPFAVTSTGPDGRFRFPRLSPQRPYLLRAWRPGAVSEDVAATPPAAGTPAPTVRLVLRAFAIATGRVLDLQDRAVGGASVRLSPAETTRSLGGPGDLRGARSTSGGEGAEGHATTTGEDGRFRLPPLPSGAYDLEVRAAGFAPTAVRQLALKGPGTMDLGDVLLAPGAGLSGRVRDQDGSPLEGVNVCFQEVAGLNDLLVGQRRCGDPQTTTDAEGRFAVGSLADGVTVDLRLDHPGYVGRTLSGIQPLPAQETNEPLDIVLEAGARISGEVLDRRGVGLAGASVQLRHSGSLSTANRVLAPAAVAAVTTGDEGRFEILGAPFGNFRLEAMADGFLPSAPLDLEILPQRPMEGLRLTLEPGATLGGRVLTPEGQPLAAATVRLSRASRDALGATGAQNPGYRATSAEDGTYELRGLPRQEVEVEVSHPRYSLLVEPVAIQEQRTTRDLRLPGGVAVAGRVVGGAGDALAGASVRLTSTSEARRGRRTTTGDDGAFLFEQVPEGEYELSGEHPDAAPGRLPQPVAVVNAPLAGLRLVLEAGGTLSGRILGLTFDQLANVQLLATRQGDRRPWTGSVDYEGAWSLQRAPAGSWNVSAIAAGGRMVAEPLELAPGQESATVDLVFGEGYTVSGALRRRGEGIPDVNLFLRGIDHRAGAIGKTDYQGRFRLEDVEPGRYQFVALQASSALRHVEELEILGDQELVIELDEIDLSVQVMDAATLEPVPRAEIQLVPRTTASTIGLPPTGKTDGEGSFHYRGPVDGPFWLRVTADGYATYELELTPETADGQDLRIELAPSPGLAIQVVSAGGARLTEAWLTVLTANGRALSSGPVTADRSGVMRLESVPPGTWEVVAQADLRSVATRAVVTVPGRGVTLRLPPSGQLRVTVPALQGQRGGVLQLVDAEGQPYRFATSIGRLVDRYALLDGTTLLTSVPAGSWRLEVHHGDSGEHWSTAVQVPVGGIATVVVE